MHRLLYLAGNDRGAAHLPGDFGTGSDARSTLNGVHKCLGVGDEQALQIQTHTLIELDAPFHDTQRIHLFPE